MNKFLTLALALISSAFSYAQTAATDTTANSNTYLNTANRMMQTDRKLTIGGYAQIDYRRNGCHLDVGIGDAVFHIPVDGFLRERRASLARSRSSRYWRQPE